MVEVGEFALLLFLFVCIYSLVTPFWGVRTGNEAMILSGERGMLVSFGLIAVASAAMIHAFVTRDFSLAYVYNYSNRDLPVFYTVSAFWAGQKGSLMFWALILTGFGSLVTLQNRRKNRKLMPYVVSVISLNLLLFACLMNFASYPFERMAQVPEDGFGLNPQLQNPGMVFHPPSLYIGFISFTIPFAFGIAALLSRQLGDVWIRTTRRWTIFSWFFLTLGNMLGGQWAYVELGWGGYWAWDPVENAAIMPWFVATAYLHSVMIQEKRDMLKVWNMVLVSLAYFLTIFGTFITRSGLIQSVHTFGETTVGLYFLGYLVVIVSISAYLIIDRLPMLRSKIELDSFFSRESSFLFNNVILLGLAFATLWGTLFPIISEAVTGQKITVGPPFFNQVNVPLGLGLLVLSGACPLLAWRKASFSNLKKNFFQPFGFAAVGSILLLLAGIRHPLAWVAFTICFFVTATIGLELYRGTRARMATVGERVHTALYNLVARDKRRYGGYIIHLGAVLVFVALTGNAFNTEVEKTVFPGEKIKIKDYELTYYGSEFSQPVPTKEEITATLLVEKNGKKIGYVKPEKGFFPVMNQPSTEVAIHSTPVEDLYVVFASMNEDNSATFKVIINALVFWLWTGGYIMGIGTIIIMWPDRKEKKLLEARYKTAKTAVREKN
jgi:cytochrome c-type biogenesis protein CcmF